VVSESLSINVGILILVGVNSFILLSHGSFVLVFCIYYFVVDGTCKEFSLRTTLEKDKLNGTNYTDWIRNLRTILKAKKKEEVLDTPLLEELDENATLAEKNAYQKAWDVDLEVGCLMLACMEPDLQMQFESVHVHDMVVALNDMFAT
jgi:hypothetical protein